MKLLYAHNFILETILKHLSKLLPELLFRLLNTYTKKDSELKCYTSLNIIYKVIAYKYSNLCASSISSYLNVISERVSLFTRTETIDQYFKVTYQWCASSHILAEKLCKEETLLLFKDHNNESIRFYVFKILAMVYGIIDVDSFLLKSLTKSNLAELQEIEDHHFMELLSNEQNKDVATVNVHKALEPTDFQSNLIPFFGLPINVHYKYESAKFINSDSSIILTKSTLQNLKSLTLGYLSNTMVILSGKVGCGKTSIVEKLLAKYLGRIKSPQLLKLQLGEQTDSKVCTSYYLFTIMHANPFFKRYL